MKWLAYLLSIYILVLSVVPCCDEEHTQEEALQVSATADGHDQPHEETDICSPFFGCHCCPGFILSLDTISVSPPTALVAPQAILRPLFPSSVSFAIWQPPRVA